MFQLGSIHLETPESTTTSICYQVSFNSPGLDCSGSDDFCLCRFLQAQQLGYLSVCFATSNSITADMRLETRKSFPRLVMLRGVKRPSTEFDISDITSDNLKSLVCVYSLTLTSVRKLHQKKNMRPECLVRFVLINNALELLQRRILSLKELDYDEVSKYFFLQAWPAVCFSCLIFHVYKTRAY